MISPFILISFPKNKQNNHDEQSIDHSNFPHIFREGNIIKLATTNNKIKMNIPCQEI